MSKNAIYAFTCYNGVINASTHMPCKGYRKKHPDICFSVLPVTGIVSRQVASSRRMQPHTALAYQLDKSTEIT